jgi:hypothetical protein
MFLVTMQSEKAKGDKARNLFFFPPEEAKKLARRKVEHLKPAGGAPICFRNGAEMYLVSMVSHVEAT